MFLASLNELGGKRSSVSKRYLSLYICINIDRFAYQFRDERDGFPPGSNIRHAVDVAVKRIVSGVSINKNKCTYVRVEITRVLLLRT